MVFYKIYIYIYKVFGTGVRSFQNIYQNLILRETKCFFHGVELLTLWSRVLLEKLIKKFTTFYGTQKFITVFTSACHLYLS
jgi:hypothetical protein